MSYSIVQYFLWLIAGSEISALKNCPNDYNRHANIGLLILITSLFAGFFAYIAASTFVDSLIGSVSFAIVWAFLIFSLDRSMVNSIKRNPYSEEEDFWKVFTPRLILAFVLAFFMSIPVDDIIFKERIIKQIDENNHNDWLLRKKELADGLNIKGSESEATKLETEATNLKKEIDSGCPLPEYRNKLAEYTTCSGIAKRKEDVYKSSREKVNEMVAERKLEQNSQNPQYNLGDIKLISQRNEAKTDWKNQVNDCKSLQKSAEKINNEWKEEKNKKLNSKNTSLDEKRNQIEKDSKIVSEKSANYQKEIEAFKGFDTQFRTLFLMPDWGVQFLKWLIFLGLLIIEVLPVYNKLRTPIGQYDREIYKREELHENSWGIRLKAEESVIKETEQYRVQKEIEINKHLIDKIALVEFDIANKSIEEWKRQVEINLPKTVTKTLNNHQNS